MTEIFDGFFWEIFPILFAVVFVIVLMLVCGIFLTIKDRINEKKSNNEKSDKIRGV